MCFEDENTRFRPRPGWFDAGRGGMLFFNLYLHHDENQRHRQRRDHEQPDVLSIKPDGQKGNSGDLDQQRQRGPYRHRRQRRSGQRPTWQRENLFLYL